MNPAVLHCVLSDKTVTIEKKGANSGIVLVSLTVKFLLNSALCFADTPNNKKDKRNTLNVLQVQSNFQFIRVCVHIILCPAISESILIASIYPLACFCSFAFPPRQVNKQMGMPK